MAGFGPAPKPEAQQRRKGRGLSSSTTRLPSSGRAGDAPAWPLAKQSKREKVLWGDLWTMPQAVVWERLGWTHEVALYVRLLAQSERGKVAGVVLIERRQQADRLGLTPMSMLRLRWEITDVDGEADQTKVVDIRSRMAEVED